MFTDLRIPAGRRPMTQGEMRVSAAIGLVISLFLLAAILEDFTPKKASILFFILFWVPMLLVHELGHALAATALGWRVREIVIGFGRTLWQWQAGETRIRIRLAPVEGYVLPIPVDRSNLRLKSALVYAAGPGAEIAVLVIVILLFGTDAVFGDTDQPGPIALKSLALVIIAGAGFNLLPFRTDGALSDGLGILSSPFMTAESIDTRLISFELREAQSLIDAGRPGHARKLVAPLLERYPSNLALQRLFCDALSQDGRVDRARALVRDQLADERIVDAVRRAWLRQQAIVELHAPEPHFVTLDLALQKALKISPGAPDLLAVRGASLVLRGHDIAGGTLLADAWRKRGDPADDPFLLAFLTVAAFRVGDREAGRHYRHAFEATNRSVALRRKVAGLVS